MIQPALLGALFIGILSALPIVNIANCCCLWIIGGGALAAYLAQPEAAPLTAGRAAAVGLLAGVLGAVVWLAAALVLDVILGPVQERLIADVLRNASDMPPEVREWLELANDRASAPVRFAAGFTLQLLAGAIFAPLGAVLAVAVGPRRSPPAGGHDVPPPAPPQ